MLAPAKRSCQPAGYRYPCLVYILGRPRRALTGVPMEDTYMAVHGGRYMAVHGGRYMAVHEGRYMSVLGGHLHGHHGGLWPSTNDHEYSSPELAVLTDDHTEQRLWLVLAGQWPSACHIDVAREQHTHTRGGGWSAQ